MLGLEQKKEFVFVQVDFNNHVPREVKIKLYILQSAVSSLLIVLTEDSCI